MKWQSVETRKGTRCRVLEGGSGTPLVFLHSAGGLLADNPFLVKLLGDRLKTPASLVAEEAPPGQPLNDIGQGLGQAVGSAAEIIVTTPFKVLTIATGAR